MKNATLKVSLYSAALLALSTVSGFAQQPGHVTIKVPFEFTAGSTVLPAGDYDFKEEPNGVLLISSGAQHKAILVLTNPESVARPDAPARVKFDKTGEQYSLTEVDILGAVGHKLLRFDRDPNATLLGTKLGVTNAASKGLAK